MLKGLHSRLLVLCLVVFSFGFIGNAETLVEPGVFYNYNLGYAKYCDYNKGVYYYACAADYKTCSSERRKDYRDYLFSIENMRKNFSLYADMENYDRFEFGIIEFYDATSDRAVMRAIAVEDTESDDCYYGLTILDKFGQPIEKIKITESDYDLLFDVTIKNLGLDIMTYWNSQKKQQNKKKR